VPVAVKRAYEKPSLSDGARVLVDRLWPRGVSKRASRIDLWLRDLAPSEALRRWFHAHVERWLLFRKRYLKELCAPAANQALEKLHRLAEARRQVTLVYAAKDTQRNNAVVLKELLEGMRKPPTGTGPAKAAAIPRRARLPRPG